MKGYEVLEKIEKGEIENGTKIEIRGRFRGELEGSYFVYNEGSWDFPIYRPDGTKYYDKVRLHDLINFSFEVLEENKDIEELLIDDEGKDNEALFSYCCKIYKKVNEVIRKINKEREEK